MKKLFLGICFIITSSLVIGQQISGRITDAGNGQPLAGATIQLGSSRVTQSDNNGYFVFRKAGADSLILRVSNVGYKSLVARTMASRQILQIKLSRFNLFMQPVEVKAVRASDKAPFTKTNISKRDIEKSNLGQDIPFLLNQTPSVIINSDAGNGIGYTGIRIRGSDATRINMTINGIPYNDAESQGLFFVDLPDFASSVNDIQIQRGVGTSSNGAGAFGATINFNTNQANTDPYAEINNSFGSFNSRKHTVKAGSGLLNDHFTIDARLSRIASDGYVDRASTDLRSFYASAAYLSEKTSLRLNVLSGKENTYQSWYGVTKDDLVNNRTINYAGMEKPGSPYENETDNYQQDHYQLFFNHAISSRMNFNTAFFFTRGKGYYEEYKADESLQDYGLADQIHGNDTIRSTDLIRRLWLDNNFYGQIISLQYKTDRDEFTVGGGWDKYEGKHYGNIIWSMAAIPENYRWYNLTAAKTGINGYAKYMRAIGNGIQVFGDVQYRHVQYDLNGFRENPQLVINNQYDFLNPKVGISLSRGNNQWYASYSVANKEPNRDDFEAGLDQQPKREQLHDIEIGWEFKKPLYSFGATLYYMLYHDQLVLTGKINDVGAYTRTNIPESYRAGVELQGKARLTSWVELTGNLSLSRNRISDFIEYFDDYDMGGQKSTAHGNTNISFSPSIVAGASANFELTRNLSISLPAKYVGRQYLDNTSNRQRSLNPFYVQDISISYTMKKFFSQTNLIVHVNNIFNKKYEPNGYTYSYISGGNIVTENYYFPMAGTNYMAGVNIRL